MQFPRPANSELLRDPADNYRFLADGVVTDGRTSGQRSDDGAYLPARQ